MTGPQPLPQEPRDPQPDPQAPRTPQGWDGLLGKDEYIVWQGSPSARPTFRNSEPMSIIMGLFFMGFSVFWMNVASKITGSMNDFGAIGAIFPLFGIPFFLIGAYNAAGHVIWQAKLRSGTHYTLTNRRAFIALKHPFKGKTLTDYPISPNSPITLDIGPPDTVWLAEKTVQNAPSSFVRKIGFEHIENGRAVFSMLRSIQKESP